MLRLIGLGVALDGLVEPAFLFTLGIGEVEHETVEKVGMSDQKAEIMVTSGCLLGELSPSSVGDVVSLGQCHLLLLLGRRGNGGS